MGKNVINKKKKGKLNKNGFAIAGIVYAILLFFIILLTSLLVMLGNRKRILDGINQKILSGINESVKEEAYKEYSITNLIQNGGFEEGSNGTFPNWSIYGTGLAASRSSDNVYSGNFSIKLERSDVATPDTNYPSFLQTVNLKQNHVYYAMEYIYLDEIPTTTNQFDLYRVGGTMDGYPEYGNIEIHKLDSSAVKKWTQLKFRFTAVASANYHFRASYFYQNVIPITYVDSALLVDLTETFGENNEPSEAWCDAHIKWFDGTSKIYYK